MFVLALDCATKFGFALRHPDGYFESGTVDFTRKRSDSAGMIFLKFSGWLAKTYDDIKNEDGDPIKVLVAYEQPHYRGGRSTEVLVGMVTQIQKFCTEHNFEHTAVHSATLKKFATGSGRASKTEMIEAATERFGKIPEDDNEADALWILAWVSEEVGLPLLRPV